MSILNRTKAKYYTAKSGIYKTKKIVGDGLFKVLLFFYYLLKWGGTVAACLGFMIAFFILGGKSKYPYFTFLKMIWENNRPRFMFIFIFSLAIGIAIKVVFILISKIFAWLIDLQNPLKNENKLEEANVAAAKYKKDAVYGSVREEMEAFKKSSNYYEV